MMWSLLTLANLCLSVDAIHVLFLSSVLYRSDTKVQSMIAKGLIENGDNVSLIAPISHDAFSALQFPRETHFTSLEILAHTQEEKITGDQKETFHQVMSYSVSSCEQFYKEPEILRLLKLPPRREYDLVIVSTLYNECVLPLLVATDANFILLTSNNRIPTYFKYALGIPEQPSFSPDSWSMNDKLIFTKRMKALFNHRKLRNLMHWWYYRSIDNIVYSTIPTHNTLLQSIQKSSIILQDSNLAIDLSLPTFGNVIPIGGIQCREGNTSSLPQKILTFLNGASHGVIYVSFGTVLKPSKMPHASLLKLVSVFRRVRQRVIWVFDDLSVIQLSDNVMPVAYVNQQDVLAHPNVVLFVTHAGHFSRQEAIYHGKPCIAFPMFDPLQFANAEYIHDKKIGLKFDITAFSEEMLINGVMEVLTNPKYKENVQTLSVRMRDVIAKPVDTAVFWIHYAVRNKGVVQLKSHSMHLYWFQYYLIDVKIFVILSTLLVLYGVTGILSWCKNRYVMRGVNKSKSKDSVLKKTVVDSKKFFEGLKDE